MYFIYLAKTILSNLPFLLNPKDKYDRNSMIVLIYSSDV